MEVLYTSMTNLTTSSNTIHLKIFSKICDYISAKNLLRKNNINDSRNFCMNFLGHQFVRISILMFYIIFCYSHCLGTNSDKIKYRSGRDRETNGMVIIHIKKQRAIRKFYKQFNAKLYKQSRIVPMTV